MTLDEIKTFYHHFGTANNAGFVWPEGKWVRGFVNASGNYEIKVCHELKLWVDVWSD